MAGRIDPRWFTPEAAARGSAVHRLTEVFDRGEPLVIPPDLLGYLDAYAEFKAIVRPVYAHSELKVMNDDLGGQIDRVCLSLWGTPALLDFKTGDEYPWHGQQLAAYNMLLPTGPRFACYLSKTGRYRLKQYDDPADHRRFVYDLARVRGTVLVDGDHWIAAA